MEPSSGFPCEVFLLYFSCNGRESPAIVYEMYVRGQNALEITGVNVAMCICCPLAMNLLTS